MPAVCFGARNGGCNGVDVMELAAGLDQDHKCLCRVLLSSSVYIGCQCLCRHLKRTRRDHQATIRA